MNVSNLSRLKWFVFRVIKVSYFSRSTLNILIVSAEKYFGYFKSKLRLDTILESTRKTLHTWIDILVKKVSYCMSEKQSKVMFPSTTLVQVRKAKPVKVN
jgi:hypothetical protein